MEAPWKVEYSGYGVVSFRTVLITSLALAGLSCAWPFTLGITDYGDVFFGSFPLSGLWLATVVYGIGKFGKRGSWTLLGLVPALFWVYITGAIYYACTVNHDCL